MLLVLIQKSSQIMKLLHYTCIYMYRVTKPNYMLYFYSRALALQALLNALGNSCWFEFVSSTGSEVSSVLRGSQSAPVAAMHACRALVCEKCSSNVKWFQWM